MTMIRSFVRFGRRQLHTVISREFIKPSSPTPWHLKSYNLSLFDQISVNTYMPIIMFYPNTGIYGSSRDKTLDLKKPLSQTLTKYYPFAGTMHAKVAPTYVDCNDNGADFLEASIDSTLSRFLQNSQHDDLEQFFPHGLLHSKSNQGNDNRQSDKLIPLAIQINHFECGGIAVAVSLSHKIADAYSMVDFLSDWAKMTRICSSEQKYEFPVVPLFIPFQYKNLQFSAYLPRSNECVTRSFMFPNSKINDLKQKVKAMTAESQQPITNPTRVEVLNWLLYKCAMEAANKNSSGASKPTGIAVLINLRDKMIEPLPEKSIGNFFMLMEILANNGSEMKPESFISELKKQKMQFQCLRNIETVLGVLSDANFEDMQRKYNGMYLSTSMCGFPVYEVDFGWGKPVKATVGGNMRNNSFILMDAPDRDGIEALVCLEKQDMAVLQSDPELLAFL